MTNILKPTPKENKTNPEVFSILNIGKRGVGKTVFIAGAYLELSSKPQAEDSKKLWLEVQESENIKIILNYIDKTGKYPPPTLKISRFTFNLKQQNWLGIKTLCNFIWSDIPGEICDIENADFRKMVFNSHGCSVFIDATALIYQSDYQQELQEIIELITPLIDLSYLNRLNFTFAFILTKCDLLEDEPVARQRINEKLKPLITHLNITQTQYQIFYSSIPLVTEKGVSILKPKGAEDPLFWLVRQVRKNQSKNNLVKVFDNLRSKQTQSQTGIRAKFRNIILLRLLFTRKQILIFSIIMLAIGGTAIAFMGREVIGDSQQDIEIETNPVKP